MSAYTRAYILIVPHPALTLGMSLFIASTSLAILSISSFLDLSPALNCSRASSTSLSSASMADFCCSSPALTALVSESSCESVAATSSYLAVRASRSASRTVWLGGWRWGKR